MTFLAALTAGAVMMVVGAASDWQSDVGREVTIQVRPVSGRDIEADVRKAVERRARRPGIADVRAFTQSGIRTAGRAVARHRPSARRSADPAHDRRQARVRRDAGFRGACARRSPAQVPSASLDDHRGWIDRMRDHGGDGGRRRARDAGARLAVTVLSVTFATRGAMATNRPIVEVLHYVGATDGFIASQFQRHFLAARPQGRRHRRRRGDRAVRRHAKRRNVWLAGTPGGDEAAALFGSLSVGVAGYLAILGQIVLMAVVTALTSRHTVNQTLATID